LSIRCGKSISPKKIVSYDTLMSAPGWSRAALQRIVLSAPRRRTLIAGPALAAPDPESALLLPV
jgi:hypothetical protein